MNKQEQALNDIKAIAEDRMNDIKLPLRTLKRIHPTLYKKAYRRFYDNTDKCRLYRKTYWKALKILREKYNKEFKEIFNRLKNEQTRTKKGIWGRIYNSRQI